MVRHTIHHTVAAKQQASWDKRKRYYEKHRDLILLRHHLCHTNNTPSITAESNTNVLLDLDDEVDFNTIITLSDCLGLVHDAKNKVLAIVPSGTPIVAGDIEVFGEGLTVVKPYLLWAQQGQDKIFNMCGVCDEWFIGHLVAMLEDLYRLALSGDLNEAYLLGETMYQKTLGLEAPGV
ncbi:hypothetical protein BDR06DRAFT_976534 [Suillus hirtellus]|nr:hypothetical protein BDR06DRAFT_976534 [Suillus hirtellus]